MKSIIIPTLLLLSSCGSFFQPSQEVVRAQQTAYIGVGKLEQNYSLLLDEYEVRTKALITYIYNFEYEQRMSDAKNSGDERLVRELEVMRDVAIQDGFRQVDEALSQWRDVGQSGHRSVKELLSAVYEYMTTTSISVADLTELIDSSLTTWDKLRSKD